MINRSEGAAEARGTLRNNHLVDSLLCFTWNVVKWRLTIKWTPRRGCVTRLKYRLSPRGQRGRGGFDSPISTGSMTIRAVLCCCTNADISIGVDECVKEKEKLFKSVYMYFFHIYDYR